MGASIEHSLRTSRQQHLGRASASADAGAESEALGGVPAQSPDQNADRSARDCRRGNLLRVLAFLARPRDLACLPVDVVRRSSVQGAGPTNQAPDDAVGEDHLLEPHAELSAPLDPSRTLRSLHLPGHMGSGWDQDAPSHNHGVDALEVHGVTRLRVPGAHAVNHYERHVRPGRDGQFESSSFGLSVLACRSRQEIFAPAKHRHRAEKCRCGA